MSSREEARAKYRYVNRWVWMIALACFVGVLDLLRRHVSGVLGVVEVSDAVGFGTIVGFAMRDWRAWIDAWGVLQEREREELLAKIRRARGG